VLPLYVAFRSVRQEEAAWRTVLYVVVTIGCIASVHKEPHSGCRSQVSVKFGSGLQLVPMASATLSAAGPAVIMEAATCEGEVHLINGNGIAVRLMRQRYAKCVWSHVQQETRANELLIVVSGDCRRTH